jgi:chemotaxis protein MotB
MSGSRGKQRHEDEHEEHVNHEAWVIPYADVLTLLMALFLVLFALGQTDEEKLKLAADSFRRELGVGVSEFNIGAGTGGSGPLANGGASVLDGAGPAPLAADVAADGKAPPSTQASEVIPADVVIEFALDDNGEVILDPATAEAPVFEPAQIVEEVLGDPLTVVEQTVREEAIGTGLLGAIGFRREGRGLVVTIVTDQVLFQEGAADVQPGGKQILDVVADALMDLPNSVIIEGHTDSRPISTPRYPSNWELSTARATSVLRYLVEQRGFPSDRIAAAGYAATHPVVPETDSAALAKNRRVEIVVLATV